MIPDGAQIRIPFPLEQTLKEYQSKLATFKQLYGI
jgi:hypothetical protein